MLDSFREKLKKQKAKTSKRITYQEFKDLAKQDILDAIACSVDYNKYRYFTGSMYTLTFYYDIDLSEFSKVSSVIYLKNFVQKNLYKVLHILKFAFVLYIDCFFPFLNL